MKTQKIKFKATLFVVMMMITGSLLAQYGQGKGNRNNTGDDDSFGPRYRGNFIETLDLTDDQQEKIDAMRTVHMEKILPFHNELREKHARLNTLSTADNPDMAAIDNLIDEIGALKISIMKTRESHQQDIRKLLNDEQRIQYDVHRSTHHKRGDGFGKRNGRGHGYGYGYGHKSCRGFRW